MTQHDARLVGKEHGILSATWAIPMARDRESAGCECGEGELCPECLEYAANDAHHENFRQTDTFSWIASELNRAPESRREGLWEAYDVGVEVGIRKGVGKRLKTKKGATP
jgi:hypothetical protein